MAVNAPKREIEKVRELNYVNALKTDSYVWFFTRYMLNYKK